MTRFFLLSISGDAFLTSEAAGRLEERVRDLARLVGLLHRPEAVRLDIYQTDRTIPLADAEPLLEIADDCSLQLTLRLGEEHAGARPKEGDANANCP